MLTKTATIILGIIQKHPVNAYELIKMLSRFQLKDWYDIADSTVYATLKSLEKKQYITGRVQKDGNMPDKTVYSLTDAGTKEWNTAIKFFLTHFDYDLIPFMIASFFAESIGVDEAIKCLEERLDYLKKNSKGLTRQIEELEVEKDIPYYVIGNVQHIPFFYFAGEFGLIDAIKMHFFALGSFCFFVPGQNFLTNSKIPFKTIDNQCSHFIHSSQFY